MKVELLDTHNRTIGFVDDVDDDCGVIVVHGPTTRTFRYHRFNSKSRMPIFIEVAHKFVGTIDETSLIGVAFGPHGTPNHRCSPFCPQYGHPDPEAVTPKDRPPVGHCVTKDAYEIITPTCEHGTKWCTGKGEKHSCDPRTAR